MKNMQKTKTAHGEASTNKDGFLFLGNQLALDLLNTRPLMDGAAREFLPDHDSLLRWYQAAGLLSAKQATELLADWGQTSQMKRTFQSILEFRERLRREVISWEAGKELSRTMIEDLNILLAEHPMLARLGAEKDGLTMTVWFHPHQPEDLLAPLAYAAARLFSKAEHERVRQCEKCVLHFHDTSKNGTRRWCSMSICGN